MNNYRYSVEEILLNELIYIWVCKIKCVMSKFDREITM